MPDGRQAPYRGITKRIPAPPNVNEDRQQSINSAFERIDSLFKKRTVLTSIFDFDFLIFTSSKESKTVKSTHYPSCLSIHPLK